MPILERTYGKLITELTDHLSQSGDEALDNDFTLQEFLDRFGMRLAQLGTILNLVAPLAEVGAQAAASVAADHLSHTGLDACRTWRPS